MGHGKIGGENLWENGTISRNLWEKWFTHGKVGGRSQADVEMEWHNLLILNSVVSCIRRKRATPKVLRFHDHCTVCIQFPL